jgi:hypothetical protein
VGKEETMYILLTILILFAIYWFVVKPHWGTKPPDTSEWRGRASQMSKQATDKARQASRQATAKAGQMYKGVRGGVKFRSDTRELATQFKRWVLESTLAQRSSLPAATENFAAWLSRLSDKELEQFTEGVARYCASVNFDLGWLNDAQVSREPELKQAVEDAVLLHSLGAWRANSVQQDVRIFMAYRDWRASPNRRKEFGQQLHQVLIERGLVTVPAELYLAPEKERLTHATAAICKAADENPAAFHLALRQLAGAPAPVPAPAPAVETPTSTPAAPASAVTTAAP